MKRNISLILCLAVLSCKKENVVIRNTASTTTESKAKIIPQDGEGDLVLGAQLQNPYTVANMIAAATAIQQQGYTYLLPNQISATHYYVKFSPSDSDQYEQLCADTTIKIYDYPLDYEITQAGNRYHDPSLPLSTPTYQYAAVKTNYVFPQNITHEILAELYIPEEDSRINDEIPEQEVYLDKLLDKAYVLTNNFSDTIKVAPATAKVTKSKYFPGGKIEIFDTRLNRNIGLEGVEMRVRRWFTTYTTRTDFNGNYRMNDDFKRDCNYSLWFSHSHYAVREHTFGMTAWIDGPKQANDWNLVISNGYNRFVGHIFRGAFRYHYGYIDGLQRPYRPNGNRTILVGRNELKSGSGINYGIVPLIRIERFNNAGVEYPSDAIFSTTCHEIAHTSHIIKMDGGTITYIMVASKLRESWCVGVEWWLTRLEYRNTRSLIGYGDNGYFTGFFPSSDGYQDWRTPMYGGDPEYTNLYINLVDNFNERVQIGAPGCVNDMVSGYTLSGIESNIIKHVNNLSSLNAKLKAYKPIGVTDYQIDVLTAQY